MHEKGREFARQIVNGTAVKKAGCISEKGEGKHSSKMERNGCPWDLN